MRRRCAEYAPACDMYLPPPVGECASHLPSSWYDPERFLDHQLLMGGGVITPSCGGDGENFAGGVASPLNPSSSFAKASSSPGSGALDNQAVGDCERHWTVVMCGMSTSPKDPNRALGRGKGMGSGVAPGAMYYNCGSARWS